ncbi:MAG: (2Fe-2S)-binding protein [Clostridiaceae bacterium]|nr:(2Fe-2S)-binding protein [Clostridiaceae bacterium]
MSKVCVCKGISEEKIIEAIKDGAKTYSDVKDKIGAGTGGCRGARCRYKIEQLIEENK